MVDFNKVSDWAIALVTRLSNTAASLDGDPGTLTEDEKVKLSNMLSEALSGTKCSCEDAEYIEGFMLERTMSGYGSGYGYSSSGPTNGGKTEEPKVERFYHDDGSYHEEIILPDKSREYMSYSKEGKITARTSTVMINGVEHPQEKVFFNEYGEITQRINFIYDEYGNLIGEEKTDCPVKKRDANGEEVKEPKKPKEKELTATELKLAQKAADIAVKNLQGRTTNTEQYEFASALKNVDSRNILEFLSHYEKSVPQTFGEKAAEVAGNTLGAAVGGGILGSAIPGVGTALGAAASGTVELGVSITTMPDSFFEQLVSEYNFPEKQDLIQKLTTDLKDYVVEKYGKEDTRAMQLELILRGDKIREKQAEEIDEIVKTLYEAE